MEAYATPDEVEYLQFAFSFVVVKLMVVWVVPEDRVPVGWPFDLSGGVISKPVDMRGINANLGLPFRAGFPKAFISINCHATSPPGSSATIDVAAKATFV